jgi:hypothetical protein
MLASCLCGALTATIADDAERVTVMCHCRDCQKRSGSPFGVMAYFPENAVVLAGESRAFSRATDSGFRYTTGFCPTCGSTLWGRSTRMPALLGIAVGAIADPTFPQPIRSVYEQSRHSWVTIPVTTARHPRGRES